MGIPGYKERTGILWEDQDKRRRPGYKERTGILGEDRDVMTGRRNYEMASYYGRTGILWEDKDILGGAACRFNGSVNLTLYTLFYSFFP